MQYGAFSTDSLMSITNRPDLVFERGEGSWLYDHQGKAYLDFIQGWAVNTLGHCPPEIAAALTTQASKLINPSPAFYNGPIVELAGLLTANSVFDRIFSPTRALRPMKGRSSWRANGGVCTGMAPTR